MGVYAFNNGSPYLQIFKRLDGNWAPLSNRFPCGELAAGTKLRLEVVGATLALLENGIERLTAYDAQAITGRAQVLPLLVHREGRTGQPVEPASK